MHSKEDGLDCPRLLMATNMMLDAANITLALPLFCSLEPADLGGYVAGIPATVASEPEADLVVAALLGAAGLQQFVDAAGVPCLSFVSIITTTGANRQAACSQQYPQLCCKQTSTPCPAGNVGNSSCAACLSGFNATQVPSDQLLKLQARISEELAARKLAQPKKARRRHLRSGDVRAHRHKHTA